MNSLKHILILFLCLWSCKSGGIVDFEYAEYTHAVDQLPGQARQFKFSPLSFDFRDMEFHEICNLFDRFNESTSLSTKSQKDGDIDQYLNLLKNNFLRLLTITQQMKGSEEKLIHMEDLINRTNPVKPDFKKLEKLKQMENNLKSIKNQIEQNDYILKQKLSKLDELQAHDRKSNAPVIMELDFNIEHFKQKIQYLKNLQSKTLKAEGDVTPDKDYDQYFKKLELQFNNQSSLISRIDQITRKKDELIRLRRLKNSAESSILALDLYIKQVESCQNQRQKIRKEFKNHGHIRELIIQLKMLKESDEDKQNIYCEGVVKKLTDKIKGMLKYYDMVASCASDLPEKMNELRKEKENLDQINEKIANLQKLESPKQFEHTLNLQNKTIQALYNDIKNWKFRQFNFKSEDVAKLLSQAEDQLRDLQRQKSNLAPVSGSSSEKSFKYIPPEILNLIKRSKQLKYDYCKEYAEYQNLASQIWSQAYEYESSMNLKTKLVSLFKSEQKKLGQLKDELINIRQLIFQQI